MEDFRKRQAIEKKDILDSSLDATHIFTHMNRSAIYMDVLQICSSLSSTAWPYVWNKVRYHGQNVPRHQSCLVCNTKT
jgi:hypothetical protein